MPRPTLSLIVLAAVATACGGASTPGTERGPRENVVAVASGPAHMLAVAFAGRDHVRAVAAEGTAMATWRPGDGALQALVGAQRILVIGADYEPWLQRAGLPPSRTITLAGLGTSERWIEVGALEHTHGGGESHSHGGVVSTVWTDPVQLRSFAATCADELSGAFEGVDAESAKASRHAFEARIDLYEKALETLRSAAGGRALIATDHGLEYLARAAGIELTVTLLEFNGPGATPNDQGIRELEALAADREQHAGVLVWTGQIHGEFAAAAREELGLRSIHFDLGGTLGAADAGDTLERLMHSIDLLRAALLEANPR